MNILLEYKLKKLGQRGKPSKDFVMALEQKLIAKGAGSSHVTRYMPVMRFAAAALSVVLLLGVGTSAYAYSSDSVTPDHPLYGLRQAVEILEEKTAVTQARKDAVRKKHLERKQHEIETMLERRPELKEQPVGQALQRVEMILEEAKDGDIEPHEIRDAVLEEVRAMQEDRGTPRTRERLKRLEDRLESIKRLRQPTSRATQLDNREAVNRDGEREEREGR